MDVALGAGNGWKQEKFWARVGSLENVGRNVDVKGDPGKVPDRNEEHVIAKWRKGDRCYTVAKNLAGVCSSAVWKVEVVGIKLNVYLKRFLNKVLKVSVWPGFSLLLTD